MLVQQRRRPPVAAAPLSRVPALGEQVEVSRRRAPTASPISSSLFVVALGGVDHVEAGVERRAEQARDRARRLTLSKPISEPPKPSTLTCMSVLPEPPALHANLPDRDRQVVTTTAPTSSVHTRKLSSVLGPKEVLIAASAASRPRAISTRPMRGVLFRASKVYQRPPR